MASHGFPLLGRRLLARGRFITLQRSYHLTPDGGWTARDIIHHPGSVVVVPWDGRRVHFLRQFRAALGAPLLELPAGKMDVPGELPEAAARRECVEELGLRAGRIELLHRCFTSPGITDEEFWIYLAEGLETTPAAPQGAEESAAERIALTVPDLVAALGDGRLEDAKSIIGAYALLRRLGR